MGSVTCLLPKLLPMHNIWRSHLNVEHGTHAYSDLQLLPVEDMAPQVLEVLCCLPVTLVRQCCLWQCDKLQSYFIDHNARVGMTLLVSAQYSMAAPTPDPGLIFMPTLIRLISTPAICATASVTDSHWHSASACTLLQDM